MLYLNVKNFQLMKKLISYVFVFSSRVPRYHYALWAWPSTCICSEKFLARVSSFLAFFGYFIKFHDIHNCGDFRAFDNLIRIINKSSIINLEMFVCRGSASLSTLARLAARSVTPAGSSTASSTVRILTNQRFAQ